MRVSSASVPLVGVVVGLVALAALAREPENAPPAGGLESKGHEWNEMTGEKVEALKLTGDLVNGRSAYAMCAICHFPNGVGRPDGTFPQLAGQHTSVLIKQIADIREGRRDNPIMYPFARTLNDSQELADVAAYIETLPIPADNGKGPGTNLERGETLYKRDCVQCHQDRGQGDPEKFYPVIAGQHYRYLLRQISDIAARRRRNANPDMVKVVDKYSPEDLDAVVDYISRLEWPERQQNGQQEE